MQLGLNRPSPANHVGARSPAPDTEVTRASPTPIGLAAAEEGKRVRFLHLSSSGPRVGQPAGVARTLRPQSVSQGGNDALPLELEAVDESHRTSGIQAGSFSVAYGLTGGPRYTAGPLEASDSPPQLSSPCFT